MKGYIETSEFQLLPSIWKINRNDLNDYEHRYYGHTWAFSINWLWWELMFYGEYKPK